MLTSQQRSTLRAAMDRVVPEDDYPSASQAGGMTFFNRVQEIPHADARVTLDPDVRDSLGIPVARLSGTTHEETLKTSEFMRQRAVEWVVASGATGHWSSTPTLGLSGGQHQAGTCRMADDPRHGVTDRYGKVHGTENVYVCDGALHVTNGGFNPVLTIMAMAFRNADWITRQT